jgi:hypothetical protein
MRYEEWLLFRQDQKPLDTRNQEGSVAEKESDTRWTQMDWNCHEATDSASGRHLHWTAATGR